MIRLALAAVLGLVSVAASAGSTERTVSANQIGLLDAPFGIEPQSCAIYRARDIKVEAKPSHGTVAVVEHAVPLPKSYGPCAGKNAKIPFVVYQPARNYRGPDTASISYTLPGNTGEMSQVYHATDFAITVK